MKLSIFWLSSVMVFLLLVRAPQALSVEGSSLSADRQKLVDAELSNDWGTFKDYIWTSIDEGGFHAPAEEADSIIAYKQADRRSGFLLKSEIIESVDLFQENGITLAVIQVTRSFSHPLFPGEFVNDSNQIYGIREANESHWRFNATTCFSKEKFFSLFPITAARINQNK
ncbi:hypothetical protein AU05_14130 [Ectopseudomonas composti]|uniref:Uncharacterized protein n=1 Tax=Ectopseudomonas composti TaxID=658457 RepID=A0ABN0SC36_9GAMM|nr:hypothetical protein [Pseudomonas composti]EZH80207.1 hypothetical protein AU05_14130 [Pseudomonas composti]